MDPSVSVLVFNCLRPIDEEAAAKIISNNAKVFVVEDHFPGTGLYNVLCELSVTKSTPVKLASIAPPPNYDLEVGVSPDFYHHKYEHYGKDYKKPHIPFFINPIEKHLSNFAKIHSLRPPTQKISNQPF